MAFVKDYLAEDIKEFIYDIENSGSQSGQFCHLGRVARQNTDSQLGLTSR